MERRQEARGEAWTGRASAAPIGGAVGNGGGETLALAVEWRGTRRI